MRDKKLRICSSDYSVVFPEIGGRGYVDEVGLDNFPEVDGVLVVI